MTELVNERDAAAFLAKPQRTLGQWRYLGRGPAYIKIEGHIRYRRADLEAYIDAHRIDPAVLVGGAPRATT